MSIQLVVMIILIKFPLISKYDGERERERERKGEKEREARGWGDYFLLFYILFSYQ